MRGRALPLPADRARRNLLACAGRLLAFRHGLFRGRPSVMSDVSGSSLARMLAVLDLFTVEHYEWTVGEVADALGYTASSTYRYVRELGRAGLLGRLPGGTYVVGAKIIELEALIRRVDPIAKAASTVLQDLARQTGCACLLSSVYGDHLINVAHEKGVEAIDLTYVRGEPLPWFRGAPGAAVLAFMPTARIRALFEKYVQKIGEDETAWRDCRSRLKRIRQAGFCVSRGELDPHAVGFGAPVIPEEEPIGSISLVCSQQRAEFLDAEGMGELLTTKARELASLIREHHAHAAAAPGTA